MIDPCEDAFFEGENLNLFNQMITRVRKETAQKPAQWEEFIGTVVHQGKGKIEQMYSTVHKNELESILLKLEKAVREARRNNLGIFFFGD